MADHLLPGVRAEQDTGQTKTLSPMTVSDSPRGKQKALCSYAIHAADRRSPKSNIRARLLLIMAMHVDSPQERQKSNSIDHTPEAWQPSQIGSPTSNRSEVTSPTNAMGPLRAMPNQNKRRIANHSSPGCLLAYLRLSRLSPLCCRTNP